MTVGAQASAGERGRGGRAAGPTVEFLTHRVISGCWTDPIEGTPWQESGIALQLWHAGPGRGISLAEFRRSLIQAVKIPSVLPLEE